MNPIRGFEMSTQQLMENIFIMRNLMVNSEVKQENIQSAIALANWILEER